MSLKQKLLLLLVVILSTLASGVAIARTTSGRLVISLSTTAAWLYSW